MYKIKDGFIVRKIGDKTMAVPVGSRTSDIHGMVALSESGELLWSLLQDGAEVETLIAKLTEVYDVDCVRAAEDIEKFLIGLKEQGVLE